MNFKKICIVAVLSNDDIISSRPCLKMGVKNDFFWSEIGSAYTIPDSTSKNFLDCGFNKTTMAVRVVFHIPLGLWDFC